jgi:hypothetical protein
MSHRIASLRGIGGSGAARCRSGSYFTPFVLTWHKVREVDGWMYQRSEKAVKSLTYSAVVANSGYLDVDIIIINSTITRCIYIVFPYTATAYSG